MVFSVMLCKSFVCIWFNIIVGQFSEFDDSDVNTTSMARFAANTTITAEGSQCSSNCSTIVIVNTPMGRPGRMRRASATSSLELGYSHTAQNSAISSETISFPSTIYDRCKKTGKYISKIEQWKLLIWFISTNNFVNNKVYMEYFVLKSSESD